jgi:endonuclease III
MSSEHDFFHAANDTLLRMPTTNEVSTVLEILDTTYPTLAMHEVHGKDPFRMLVAVVLSQRARDAITVPTAATLFERITTAQDLADFPIEELEAIIQPIGFHKEKAKSLKELANVLVDQYGGQVPTTEEELLSLPRVGRKTANIILTTFFDTPQIAVDIHVHRITNRLGWVQTKNPLHTEKELTQLIPQQFHSIVNRVFVAHGQNICLPIIPKCSVCPVEKYCQKVGVKKFR